MFNDKGAVAVFGLFAKGPSVAFLESLRAETAGIRWNQPFRSLVGTDLPPDLATAWSDAQARVRQAWPKADELALTWLQEHERRQEFADSLHLLGLLALWVATSPAQGAAAALMRHLGQLAGSDDLVLLIGSAARAAGAGRNLLDALFRQRLSDLINRTPASATGWDPNLHLALGQAGAMIDFLDDCPESDELVHQILRKYRTALARSVGPVYQRAMLRLVNTADADPTVCEILVQNRRWSGIEHFLAASRQFERYPQEKPPTSSMMAYNQTDHPLTWAVLALASIAPPAESDRKRAGELARLSPDTLLTAAVLAPAWAPLIEPLLQWPALADLLRWLQANGETSHWRYHRIGSAAVAPESQEDEEEAVDRALVLCLCEQMGEPRLAKLLKHPVARAKYRNAIYFLKACRGENVADVEASFLKRNKTAVRALGLLPDEGDILQRYLALRKFIKETRQFGSQRQASETQAAEDALANLAATAGYADRSQLEWAMEAQLARENDPTACRWTFRDYTLWLEPDARATPVVEKAGKRLKDVPPAIRKDPDYSAVKEARALLQGQWERIQRRLESAMARGEIFDREAFGPALSTPAGRALTENLVLQAWVGDAETPVELLAGKPLEGAPPDP
jgi:hypothetical protein